MTSLAMPSQRNARRIRPHGFGPSLEGAASSAPGWQGWVKLSVLPSRFSPPAPPPAPTARRPPRLVACAVLALMALIGCRNGSTQPTTSAAAPLSPPRSHAELLRDGISALQAA